jgi:hypothetical protein
MRTNLFAALVAGALLSSGAAALADDTPKQVKDMECLVGTWKGAATMTMGDQRAQVKVSWSCKRTPGQYGVLCSADMTGIPGLAHYYETDLFGYDPGANKYHWFAVTNGGETHDHVAAVPSDEKIEFVYSGTQDRKPLKEVIDLTIGKDAKSLTFRSETFVDGKSVAVLEGSAKK